LHQSIWSQTTLQVKPELFVKISSGFLVRGLLTSEFQPSLMAIGMRRIISGSLGVPGPIQLDVTGGTESTGEISATESGITEYLKRSKEV